MSNWKRGEKELETFKILMQRKLEMNAHKGDWKAPEDRGLLLFLLKIEVEELYEAMQKWTNSHAEERERRAEDVALECADVANFAMFIADSVGAIQDEWERHYRGATERPKIDPDAEGFTYLSVALRYLLPKDYAGTLPEALRQCADYLYSEESAKEDEIDHKFSAWSWEGFANVVGAGGKISGCGNIDQFREGKWITLPPGIRSVYRPYDPGYGARKEQGK
jgi:NTP pyrophosphatase (non-canonical NTP hydrolase)